MTNVFRPTGRRVRVIVADEQGDAPGVDRAGVSPASDQACAIGRNSFDTKWKHN
jgi:hypothetical protein